MYEVDGLDRVVVLSGVPPSDAGAPMPTVLADDDCLLLCYIASKPHPSGDGAHLEVVQRQSQCLPVVLVQFQLASAHMFGSPNDEAFDGHPLAARGLRPYGAYEVTDSSWVRRLERMNRVCPILDRKRSLDNPRHFIFSFHDSTFECVAGGYSIERVTGSPWMAIDRMRSLMAKRSS